MMNTANLVAISQGLGLNGYDNPFTGSGPDLTFTPPPTFGGGGSALNQGNEAGSNKFNWGQSTGGQIFGQLLAHGGSIAQIIGAIKGNGIVNLGNGKVVDATALKNEVEAKSNSSGQSTDAVIQLMLAQAEAAEKRRVAEEASKKNTTMYVVGGILGLGVIGTIIYVANKKK